MKSRASLPDAPAAGQAPYRSPGQEGMRAQPLAFVLPLRILTLSASASNSAWIEGGQVEVGSDGVPAAPSPVWGLLFKRLLIKVNKEIDSGISPSLPKPSLTGSL